MGMFNIFADVDLHEPLVVVSSEVAGIMRIKTQYTVTEQHKQTFDSQCAYTALGTSLLRDLLGSEKLKTFVPRVLIGIYVTDTCDALNRRNIIGSRSSLVKSSWKIGYINTINTKWDWAMNYNL